MEREARSDPAHFIAVIGRGGEQISRIQAESGCKIQIASGKGYFLVDSFSSNQCYTAVSRICAFAFG